MKAEEWIKENICMDVHEIREFRGDRIAELMEQYAEAKAVNFCMKRNKAPESFREQYENDYDQFNKQ